MERQLSKSARLQNEQAKIDTLHQSSSSSRVREKVTSLFSAKNRVKTSVVALLAVIAIGLLAEYRAMRVRRVEAALQSIDAEYLWNLDGRSPSLSDYPTSARQMLAACFGKSMVSDFASVKINNDDIKTENLDFIADLRSLESLQLHSNGVTDDTLRTVSELPELRYLSLAGEHFSIFGLLELRNASSLRELDLNVDHLTPNEMALLASELDGVELGRGVLDDVPSVLTEEHPVRVRPQI